MTQPEDVVQAATDQQDDFEMVIGTVQSGNPLTVAARNGTVSPGRLSTGEIMAGGTVAMLRQGATWLALGQVIGANGVGGLGLTQLLSGDNTADLSLTNADQDVPGIAIPVTITNPNAILVALWFVDYQAIAANSTTATCWLSIDGVTQSSMSGATCRMATSGDRGTNAMGGLFALGVGAHTIGLRARWTAGANATLLITGNTQLIVGVFE